jgi:hypothetical protein
VFGVHRASPFCHSIDRYLQIIHSSISLAAARAKTR